MAKDSNDVTLPGGSVKLVRTLGMKEGITMTTGVVIGVGLFTVGANGVGMLGGMIILSTFIAFLISLWPALLYAEMGTMFPLAGGSYNYAQKGVNRLVANIAGWNYSVALIACTAGEALAFSNYFGYLLKGFGVEADFNPRILAILVAVIFIIINFRGIKIAARWQNAFIFFFWACALVWFVIMARSGSVEFANYFPDAIAGMPNFGEFVTITGLVWWCFAGFELVVGFGGEIKYPQINLPRVLMISPFIIFTITAMFQFFLVGIVPPTAGNYEMLAVSEAPYAEGMLSAGILGLPLIVLCIGIAFGGDMSTINPGIGGSSRYVYKMADDGALPGVLAKVHPKFKTPHIAIVTVGVIILVLVMKDIIFIASLSLFSVLCCYIISFISYIGLKIKYSDMKRPFKAPGGIVGAVVSIALYAVLVSQIGTEALIIGIIYTAAATAFYLIKTRVFKGEVKEETIDSMVLEEMPEPPADEKKKMDITFWIWISVAVGAAAFTIILYLVAFMS